MENYIYSELDKKELDGIAKVYQSAKTQLYIMRDKSGGLPYEETSERYKEFLRRSIRYIQDNPNLSYDGVHNKICSEKVLNGWIYGENYSEELKTDPLICAIEDSELKEDEELLFAIVNTITSYGKKNYSNVGFVSDFSNKYLVLNKAEMYKEDILREQLGLIGHPKNYNIL